MNNNGTILGIIAVVLVLIIGWWFISKNAGPLPGANTSPPTNTTQTGVPPRESGAPIVLTNQAAIPTDTTVVVTGNVTPNGAFTSYWYEYGASPSLGNKTRSQMIGSGFVAIAAPAYISGLTKDTTYHFRLNAQNQSGTVVGAQYSFRTTQGVPPPVGSLPKVTTLPESNIAKNAATLNGEVVPNRSVTQYWFEYGETANLGNTTAFVSAGDGTTVRAVSMRLSDLGSSTTYYFRLNAQNQFGTVNGAIVNFKTSGPATTTKKN